MTRCVVIDTLITADNKKEELQMRMSAKEYISSLCDAGRRDAVSSGTVPQQIVLNEDELNTSVGKLILDDRKIYPSKRYEFLGEAKNYDEIIDLIAILLEDEFANGPGYVESRRELEQKLIEKLKTAAVDYYTPEVQEVMNQENDFNARWDSSDELKRLYNLDREV